MKILPSHLHQFMYVEEVSITVLARQERLYGASSRLTRAILAQVSRESSGVIPSIGATPVEPQPIVIASYLSLYVCSTTTQHPTR